MNVEERFEGLASRDDFYRRLTEQHISTDDNNCYLYLEIV